MALSSDIIFNSMLNQYKLQTKTNTMSSDTSTSSVNKEIENQKIMFQTMLIQMMDSSGTSMMTQLMSSAISNQNSYSVNDSLNSLNSLNDFNAKMRDATRSLSNDNNSNGLGLTSAKYESNLNPAAISNTLGDYGGKSYGAWQFSSKTGSLDSFISSLKIKDKEIYSRLTEAKAKDGNEFGKNFDETWTSIALCNKDKFLKLQQNSIKGNYYDVAALELKQKYGFDVSKKSDALKESLLSTVVQHGVTGALSVFSKLNLKNSDKNIINDLYNERQKVDVYFRDSSQDVKQSVYNRFTREKQDMLNMLNA
ncbi:vgrg protein [Clostridium estertheticum]|uniref:VgrG-related protein n=1 Tax=Clostridium estertheticum TaxID=238834 RepID=UPI001C0B01E8|nr:vgrg protein [Clostridium estertheticum]MBU3215424.1 vgrg protein [Clostridium estertheticum]WAG56165.1 vgrg protein [Clostridium estertheticum]